MTDDRGQAAVELALALPVVVLALLTVAQVVVTGIEQVAVVHAARDAARRAAVGEPAAPADVRAGSSAAPAIDVSVRTASGTVVAVARLRSPVHVPLLGGLVAPEVVEATATMAAEP